ncbi:MAG: GNAT family N-acyltransferase, partial [Bacteroidota bacterium]
MRKPDLSSVVQNKLNSSTSDLPSLARRLLLYLTNKILHMNEVTDFLNKYGDKDGMDFVESLFEYLDFSYNLSNHDRNRIPSEGRLVVAANHPLGALDGLALLSAIREIRPDVKIIANEILMNIDNLANLLLPYDVFSIKSQKQYILRIEEALNSDEAVIFFPAAEVSRMSPRGIADGPWRKGAVNFAAKYEAPVLPVYIKARNSWLFYLVSMISKKLSTLLLPREMFKMRGKTIKIRIGNPVPGSSFTNSVFNIKALTKLLKKHVYKIGKGKKGIFKTEKTVIHPVASRLLKKELAGSQLLGQTTDNKIIYLCDYDAAPNVVREISRLREITFRKVGEGTGRRKDHDIYDKYYSHLVLWDSENLEIVGSYRIGSGREIMKSRGIEGLYNSGQFDIHENFAPVIDRTIELGRSFVQQKYWGSNALDYLWQGIGAYLSANPDVRYLMGAVSISNSYPRKAKDMIIYYYKKWYPSANEYVTSRNPYKIGQNQLKELAELFSGSDRMEDFRILKINLRALGYSIPVLYRKYTEICEPGGVSFPDFGVDSDFSNSVDGLCLLDLSRIKDSYRERYF